jgi:hypothetical protein
VDTWSADEHVGRLADAVRTEDGMSIRGTRQRRWRWLSIVAVANLAAVGLAAAPSQAQAVSLCSGTAEGFTIAGDLAVPAGASCSLVNSTVTGNVVVRTDANLSLDASTIRGDLVVRSNGFVGSTGSSVVGVTRLRQAFGVAIEDSELGGGVDARESGFFFSDGTTHGARVVSASGQTVILSGWVEGDVRTNVDLLTDLRDTVVTGAMNVNEAELGSVICESEIDGNVVLRNSGELIQLGGQAPTTDCAFNVFGGALTLQGNDADIRISDNVIRGNLTCTGNAAAPTGADNRLRGQGVDQCAELAPAAGPALSGFGAMAGASRLAGVERQIETRSTETANEVAEVGPANL